MARYPLSLPQDLKQQAEDWARRQGVSLNQFILWAVAEKVGALSRTLDDPDYPGITYRRGAAGQPTPVLRGSGLRVQTLVVASQEWKLPLEELAAEYEVPRDRVQEALAFYSAHRSEVDALIKADAALEVGDSQHD